MRIDFRFDDRRELLALLDDISDTRELAVPAGQGDVRDGDWVLACFHTDPFTLCVPARAFGSGEAAHLNFEDRDWERLLVTLDRSRPGTTEPIAKDPQASVLIVDHDQETCQVISALLNRAGYRASSASAPEVAFEQLMRDDWQLVIVDCEAAGMSSSLFCRRLRADRRCASLPILLMSARDESEVEKSARAIGADDFILKPFRAPELIARSTSLLARVGG